MPKILYFICMALVEGQIMSDRKSITIYIAGTMLQMLLVCIIIAVLRMYHIAYSPIWNTVFLIIGGTSSALWGIVVSILSKRVYSVRTVIKDFFNLKQSVAHYALVLVFIAIIFAPPAIVGGFNEGIKWYTFFLLFALAIIFGGIEEIGWRYTFQPLVEKKCPFEIACIITFVCWGAWHYMYFYITDTLQQTNHIPFLFGLLGNCFILGTIYRKSKSLWLCVLYHCLLNVFSQTILAGSLPIVFATNSICILCCIALVRIENRKLKPNHIKSKTT